MSVKFLFFAQCADWVGFSEFVLALDGPQALETFLQDIPSFAPILKNRGAIRVAVNQKLADFSTEIRDNDEIAFMPPYSGG